MTGTLVALSDGSYAQKVVSVNAAGAVVGGGGSAGPSADDNPGTATVTSVNSANSSTSLLAANNARQWCSIANDDANDLYILLGSGTASATNYSAKIVTGEYITISRFTGAITGIWAADGSGAARITEIT